MTAHIGETLKYLVEEVGHSNGRKLATKLGVSPSTVMRWFDNPRLELTDARIDRIAEFLRMAPDELRQRLKAQKGQESMVREGGIASYTDGSDYREDLVVERLDSYARRLRDLATEYQGRINEITRLAEDEIERAKANVRKRPARMKRGRRK